MGNSTGPGAPNVGEPVYKGYSAPANWDNPAVTGHDLIVHTGTLRTVGSTIGGLAHTLNGALSGWQSAASEAMAGSAAGTWSAAQSLQAVIGKAYSGVQQFTTELQKAHNDMQTRLYQSADNYDAAEQHVTSFANAATDPTATIVGAGGNNTPAAPTPQQARVIAQERRLASFNGGNENWQQSIPITEDASCNVGTSSGYTWDIVRSQLAAADPGAMQRAGQAYMNLYTTLTEIAGVLPTQGATLAGDWGGPNAVTAVTQVQQLHQTASDMQANTYSAASALTWYGNVLTTFQNSLPAAGSTPTSGPHAAAANQAAEKFMQALNQHTQNAFYNMPGAVNKNLPPPLTTTGGSGTSGSVGYGGANGGGVPGSAAGGGAGGGYSGGTVPGVSTPGGTGTGPGVTTPGGTAPGGTSPGGITPGGTSPGTPPGTITPAPTRLAGVSPGVGIAPSGPTGPSGPGGVGSPPPVITTPGGTGPGPGVGVLPPPVTPGSPGSPGGPGSPGSVGAVEPAPGGGEPGPADIGVAVPGLSDPAPGEPGISPAGVITGPGPGGAAGEDGLAASGDAVGGEAMGGPGGMMPMMGTPGGAGQSGLGRERETWTSEDEGTWGPDASGAADGAGAAADGGFPGMMPVGAGGGQGQERDRNRLAWMSEEDDLWGAGQPATPPVISQN
jgi:hypothetical protein